jgi:ParB family chromosome partitioning protein
VREVEEIARTTGAKSGKQQIKGAEAHARAMKNANTLALERRLSDALGLAVSIDHRERGGTLSVRYRSLDQLDEVVRRLERKH